MKRKTQKEGRAVREIWITGLALVALFLWGCLMLLPKGFGAQEGFVSVPELLGKVQARYAVEDFAADFMQESHLEAMAIVDTAEGHVLFKPPSMMRWHYKSPEEYMIITDGQTVWVYRPADRQVMVGKAVDYFGDMQLAAFFSSPAKLLDRFNAELVEPRHGEKDGYELRLVPKEPHPNVREVFLFISKETFDIVRSDTYSVFGDKTRLRFSGFALNQGVDPSTFRFEIPEGTDVLQLDSPY